MTDEAMIGRGGVGDSRKGATGAVGADIAEGPNRAWCGWDKGSGMWRVA